MKLGFVSSILDGWTFEEMIDEAAALGFSCVEVACWPTGKAERRYAGVSHIDVDGMDEKRAGELLRYTGERNIEISALAFYPNMLDHDPEKRAASVEHLHKVIDAAALLNVNMVTTFIGRDQTKNIDDNLKLVREIWPEIVLYAERAGVRIAIENCPMLFGNDQWPGGQNLMISPAVWREVFRILPSDNIGLNFDPSHFVWQMMDYIRPVKEFRDKIFHVHFKDIKLKRDELDQVGILGAPLDYMTPKIPGLGDVDWGRFVSALTDIGYEGCSCIEVEDRAFEGSRERIISSLAQSKQYMQLFVS